MKEYKIIYEREGCIGVTACVAVNPEAWDMDEFNKAKLLNGNFNEETGKFERIIEEKDLQINMEAAQVCPVNVIHIIDIETGKELV
ncbi:MAG: ferredoxin [Candidatus Aenigmarchaeota archaeon]|nr:ferredoxin [Candidatus Aenigmarchaeota archaeon]